MKGEKEWRWCANVLKERMDVATKLAEKQLPYSIDGAYNGTYLSSADRTVEWIDTEVLLPMLIGGDTANLSKEQHEQVRVLVEKHKVLWTRPTGAVDVEEGHIIKLKPGAVPPSQGFYRVGPREDEIIADIVQEWLGDDCIEPTTSSQFAAPVLLVRKEDGSYRLVVDYRRLNKVTEPNKFPTDNAGQILMRLRTSRWFSKFDLTNGFLQVMMEDASRDFTTFITSRGLYRFKRMPFGLINSPATFARVMAHVLGPTGLRYNGVEAYVDDVLVHPDNWNTHLATLDKLFTRFVECGARLKPSKCVMCQSQVRFLGHVVSHMSIAPDPKKVEAVWNWPRPGNTTDVRAFLGLTGYYRRYIRGYSIKADALFDLLQANKKFEWGKRQEEAFAELKSDLCKAPIVCPPNWEFPFILITDAASKRGIGCVLVQRVPLMKDGKPTGRYEEKVIAYASKKFSKAELRWPVRDQEAWAIVWGIQHFHEYLSDGHFFVETDHQSLQWLFSGKTENSRCMR